MLTKPSPRAYLFYLVQPEVAPFDPPTPKTLP